MNYFEALGHDVDNRWRKANYDELALPELAEAALLAAPAHRHVKALEPLVWLQSCTDLCGQYDVPGRFGQPPITMFRRANLLIDVYYWMEGTTSVHEHAFSGAFQVMAGSSVHVEYTFQSAERVSSRLQFGRAEFKSAEVLGVGDTRRILSGRRFAHSLFHLDQPSVTVVVRTVDQPDAAPQLSYLRPHVAMDPTSLSANVLALRRAQALNILREADADAFHSAAAASSSHSDLHTFFLILREYALQGASVDNIGDAIETARPRFGSRVDMLMPVIEHELSQTAIIKLRRVTKNPEHRFFLALLANAPDRVTLMNLIRQRFPEEEPEGIAARWLIDIPALWRPSGPSAADVPLHQSKDIGRLLREYLRGRKSTEITSVFEAEGRDVNAIDTRLCMLRAAMRRGSVLRVLCDD
jgi:hypothetical protein